MGQKQLVLKYGLIYLNFNIVEEVLVQEEKKFSKEYQKELWIDIIEGILWFKRRGIVIDF